MGIESSPEPPKLSETGPKVNRLERNRLIVHLARVFSRRYDIAVRPSGTKGLWATGFDKKTDKEFKAYMEGERATLDDLPPEAFVPKTIMYDEEGAQKMSLEEITTILHHEAGHAKYSDFRSMIEGQKQAKDEGNLATSFWLTFEGIEDPRVNNLEGEESPAIDRQIRKNQAKDFQDRITESPLSQRPKMLQFAYNSCYYWLHGEAIPELKDTDVGKAGELAKPLLEQYFQNTDPVQRKILQRQIWDIAKGLEEKDLEDEKKRQTAQKKGMKGNKGQPQQGGQGESQGQSSEGEGENSAPPAIPGGSGNNEGAQSQEGGDQQKSGKKKNSKQDSKKSKKTSQKNFLDRLRDTILGKKPEEDSAGDDKQNSKQDEKEEGKSKEKERPDLSQLTEEQLREIEEAINQLSPQERAELEKKAREIIDDLQKGALEKELGKTLKLEKNKETGEWEVKPQFADEKTATEGEGEYKKALGVVEAKEKADSEREEGERRRMEQIQRELELKRREKIEMEKAGFDENEREKFLLYQKLEDAMYPFVRNFRQAIEKVIPRRKEPVYEGGYFSGPKFDKRDLVRKAPLGDEQFHMRQTEKPIGEPRLFIGLLVDNSGSMGGKKQEEARKTVIFFAKVCRDMGIPFMAGSFGSDAKVIKQFKQDFDNPAEKIKPKIIDSTNAREGSTNMHAGLKVTIDAMNLERRKLMDSHGLVFVITDGGANAGLTGNALKTYIEENRGRLTFKAFGLSGSASERSGIQNFLNNYFGEGNCAYPEGFTNLPDEAFRVLRVNLMQFQRFLS